MEPYASPRMGQTSHVSKVEVNISRLKSNAFRFTGIFPLISVAVGFVLKLLLLISYYPHPIQIH